MMKHLKKKHEKKLERFRMKAIKSIMMDNYSEDKDKMSLLPSQIYKYWLYPNLQ